VAGFRDYQTVIQAGTCSGDRMRWVPPDPGKVRALFDQMVSEAWTPAEAETLHRAARAAFL
jgi:hypothetical protein